jgi:hypothetical protein
MIHLYAKGKQLSIMIWGAINLLDRKLELGLIEQDEESPRGGYTAAAIRLAPTSKFSTKTCFLLIILATCTSGIMLEFIQRKEHKNISNLTVSGPFHGKRTPQI